MRVILTVLWEGLLNEREGKLKFIWKSSNNANGYKIKYQHDNGIVEKDVGNVLFLKYLEKLLLLEIIIFFCLCL